MSTSRTKYILCLLAFAFVYLFVSPIILDQAPDSFQNPATQAPWQSMLSVLLWPVKAILMGPLLPFIDFLRQDPDTPPPFFLAGFATYWTILAVLIHYLITRGMLATRRRVRESH